MERPYLQFKMPLPSKPTSKLVEGILTHHTGDGRNLAYLATSGINSYQYIGSHVLRGKGQLPARKDYVVSTRRLWMPQVKGVEGSFYPIAPFMVDAGKGVRRGDFGIHFDANVPGSAGCVVIRLQDHWDLFRKLMEDSFNAGIEGVPLEVIYV